ncbi:hypothetical protein P8631_07585 [Guyparkeria sp. 1SP6A2]|nr:hypothetical protein [Guyparkeria sp. 1SP6A2]
MIGPTVDFNLSSMNRRHFLITSIAAAASPALVAQAGASAAPPEAFKAFVDTLLPADEFGPAASSLGIVVPAWRGLITFPSDRKFMQNGCAWLDYQAGGAFDQISASLRGQIVGWMEQSAAQEAPNLFYRRVRSKAVSLYYRHPDIQSRLGIPHPPQPLGYINDLISHVATHGE